MTLILIFITFETLVSATGYSISSSGDDTNNNGLSSSTPWKTLIKVNSIFPTLKPGDRVLFKCGDTFYGTLNISASGASNNPIEISAYGTAVATVITGFTDISGSWIRHSGNIWKKAVTKSSDIRYLNIGGVNYLMGRYPNTGRNIITTGGSTSSIQDNVNLTQANDYWNGAEIVCRPNPWAHERQHVTDFEQATNKLTFTAGTYTTQAGFGYFLQNHINCLDNNGDWCWDGSYIYMYNSSNPNSLSIKVSTYDYGIYNSSFDYLTINNLYITGYNVSGIYIKDSDYNIINTNSITRSVIGIYGDNSDYLDIINNKVRYCGFQGITSVRSNHLDIGSNTALDGFLDEIAIYNRVISVDSLYNSGTGRSYPF